MLRVIIPAKEHYDELNNEFFKTKEQVLQLEHSLVALSKWESKWKKPFLVDTQRSFDEMIDYIRCMTITQNVDPIIYQFLPVPIYHEIIQYIDDPMTATVVTELGKPTGKPETITSELIYFWMVSYRIPFECQKWHLNRLLTLIRICSIKNASANKQNPRGARRDILNQNRLLNEQRKAAMNTRG